MIYRYLQNYIMEQYDSFEFFLLFFVENSNNVQVLNVCQ